jgi:hypothetical protein
MPADEKLASYLAGMLSEKERLEFEEELLSYPAARWEVLNQQRISAGLKALLATDGERMAEAILAAARGVGKAPPAPLILRARKRRALWPARVLAVAAALVLCAALYRFLIPPEAARVSREIATVWKGSAPATGKELRPGWLRLRRGAVELEFSKGAKVMVEGPAELRIISGQEAFLRQGRLRAVVPERARGFTIRGEGFAAVDLGTEFGVIAGESPEVHVFTGKVEFQGNSQLLLGGKEAVRVSGGGAESIPARPELFADGKRLAALEAGAELDRHPEAIAHYDFAGEGVPLQNCVSGADLKEEVVGCRSVEGRWPGNAALQFGGGEDHVSLTLPGEMKSLTLLAWVRVDSLPEVQGSLMMGSTELPGDVHWYLHENGSLGFAVVGEDGQWQRFHSPMIFRRANLEQWRCMAASFDGATGLVTHFLDGKAIASQSIGTRGPLKPGTVQVGNWALRAGDRLRASKDKTSPKDFRRALQGRIDELAIFSTALSTEEIRLLSEAGKP